MEELIDFDEWMANYKPVPLEYVATFDPKTGKVISVGPSNAFVNENYKIPLDIETAESILNGEILIHNCLINMDSNLLEISEIKNLRKLDDVLHRIISKDYFVGDKIDFYITYDSKKQELKFQLSNEYGGTKKNKSTIKREIIWHGDTEMKFYITDYNDPNLIFEIISVKINELKGKTKVIKDISYSNFSVYTRRLFKNYIIEYK